jgi:hypothetical protein
LRLNPCDRVSAALSVIGSAYFFKREFDTAVAKLQASIQERPGFARAYQTLAACYAHMGRLEEARGIVARLRTITSEVVPDLGYLRDPEHRELFLSGLRLAAGAVE